MLAATDPPHVQVGDALGVLSQGLPDLILRDIARLYHWPCIRTLVG